jgi:hypothetical protein
MMNRRKKLGRRGAANAGLIVISLVAVLAILGGGWYFFMGPGSARPAPEVQNLNTSPAQQAAGEANLGKPEDKNPGSTAASQAAGEANLGNK